MELANFCDLYNIYSEDLERWKKERPNLYDLLMTEKKRLDTLQKENTSTSGDIRLRGNIRATAEKWQKEFHNAILERVDATMKEFELKLIKIDRILDKLTIKTNEE
ncbi:hypothetical protein [Campylobacter sp. JMF_03 NE3]|uniref:hypothetical protein n=1 Tax=Campylobacter sp. JMF_03 NE3 TaxID=2983831 RepID=UPI0022E99947|nr:hypothetical protein [Campylobacter sp. JMF_03 NE3]MDA3053503.1 hypothetical protein [Campylobacter sp. JMF_03 NE3]